MKYRVLKILITTAILIVPAQALTHNPGGSDGGTLSFGTDAGSYPSKVETSVSLIDANEAQETHGCADTKKGDTYTFICYTFTY